MSNPEDSAAKQEIGSPPPPSSAEAADVESQRAPPPSGGGVSEIVRRWQSKDLFKRRVVGLRAFGLVFSLLAFVLMACNKHGDWKDFDKYEEFRYVLAIAILSSLYTGAQVLREVHEISTAKSSLPPQKSALIDFIADQILAYLLMSATSSAIPMISRMREGSDNMFTDSLAASITMSFFAFLSLALSAVMTGYKLSTQSYI